MQTPTTGVKYIGSKMSLISYILKCIDTQIPQPIHSAIDVFTGTTRVAQAFKARGWTVQTSDLSWASACYSGTWIANASTNTHLQPLIDELNALPGRSVWITPNYCDARGVKGGIVRVWQQKNGQKADAIRTRIAEWEAQGALAVWERDTLITSLILALDKVDNTVGVQQAYLKDWCTRSYNDLHLELPHVTAAPQGAHQTGDCLSVVYQPADLAYLDPPYSAHSYSTYYHIWDSIARWDRPQVGLNTNRRVDRISGNEAFDTTVVSQWNSKKTALAAFEAVVARLPVRWVLISYNNESLISIESLLNALKKYKKTQVTTIDYKRNIMCQIGNAVTGDMAATPLTRNIEYLILVEKN